MLVMVTLDKRRSKSDHKWGGLKLSAVGFASRDAPACACESGRNSARAAATPANGETIRVRTGMQSYVKARWRARTGFYRSTFNPRPASCVLCQRTQALFCFHLSCQCEEYSSLVLFYKPVMKLS